MPEAGGGSVQLLEADPDLARGLDPRRIREVSQRLFVRAIDAPRGIWTPGRSLNQGSQPIGLLVLDGLLVREATVGDHPCAELLGPGDLLRAWDDREAEILLPRSVEWTALTHSRLAIIDQALAVRAAQWPEIFASLVERAARRSSSPTGSRRSSGRAGSSSSTTAASSSRAPTRSCSQQKGPTGACTATGRNRPRPERSRPLTAGQGLEPR